MPDWRVLTGIILVAAVAGWLIVREVPSRHPVPSAGPSPTVEMHVAASPRPRRSIAARAAGTTSVVQEIVVDQIGRKRPVDVNDPLAVMEEELRDDMMIQSYVFPPGVRGARMPSLTVYQRTEAFWQPWVPRGVFR